MSKQNKDLFDTIDEYFSQINAAEIAQKVTEGVDSLSEKISSSIEESLKNNGYNNLNEFFEGEIKDRKGKKPSYSKFLKDYSSRMDYVKEAMANVDYEIKFRGYFKDGHQQALKDIDELLDRYANDLDALHGRIKEQIKEIRRHQSQYNSSYTSGYIEGCEYVQKAIQRSKQMMMKKILQEI